MELCGEAVFLRKWGKGLEIYSGERTGSFPEIPPSREVGVVRIAEETKAVERRVITSS